MDDITGFVCPLCFVAFITPEHLKRHFVEMHSDRSDAENGRNGLETDEDGGSTELGHQFKLHRVVKPSTCEACGEIIWQDASVCQLCHITVHMEHTGDVSHPCAGLSKEEEDEEEVGVAEDDPHPVDNNHPMDASPPPPKGILPAVRRQVARGRGRYVNEEFDLDLTYITERIIAMSFPASGLESTYRNSLTDVAKMLQTKHQNNFLIFNLSERSYDISKFNNQVLDFGWPDHLAPSLERLSCICKSMKSWLDSDPQHVVVVHCKGGKGRTGCVIAAFMHYSEICRSAADALDHFAMKRFYDSKLGGVTQPSQRKYVHYFADLLAGKINYHAPSVVLNHIIIHGIPNIDGKGGCRPFLKIYENLKVVYTSSLYACPPESERVRISIPGGKVLRGEVLVKCFHKRVHGGVDAIFRVQFPSGLVRGDYRLVFPKMDLDDAFKDKRFPDTTKVELLFSASADLINNTGSVDASVRNSLVLDHAGKPSPLAQELKQVMGELVNKRDSYEFFNGGYDTGKPETPDLIQLDPLKLDPIPQESDEARPRIDSFKMEPTNIRHQQHPDTQAIYTVVSDTFKKAKLEQMKATLSEAPPTAPPNNKTAVLAQPPQAQPLPKAPVRAEDSSRQPKLQVQPRPLGVVSPELSRKQMQSPSGSTHLPPPSVLPPPSTKNIYMDDPDDHSTHQQPAQARKPSYDAVNVDRLVRLHPLSPRKSGMDDEMWVQVTYQSPGLGETSRTSQVHRSDPSLRHSVSSSASSDVETSGIYSALTDLVVGEVTMPRRHSFSGSIDNRIVIVGEPNRESIIPISGQGEGAESSTIYDDVSPEWDEGEEEEEVDGTSPMPRPHSSRGAYVNAEIRPEVTTPDMSTDLDYANSDPEGLSHTYTNEDALMVKKRSENVPLPEPAGARPEVERELTSSSPGQKLMDRLLKLSKLKHSVSSSPEIRSNTISEEERVMTLAPFELQGVTSNKINKDYEAFFLSAWDGGSRGKSRDQPPSSAPSGQQGEEAPLSKKNKRPPLPATPTSQPPQSSEREQGGAERVPRPHVKSQRSHPPDAVERTTGVAGKKAAPPKPRPYYQQVKEEQDRLAAAVLAVKSAMPSWYHPSITREVAMDHVQKMAPGSFIVRDSQSVGGGYAITIKISEEEARRRKKLPEGTAVTADMCVSHFLIQPDPAGVKLQGWNEPPFLNLTEFIAQHTIDKLCLPCVLILPKGGQSPRQRQKKPAASMEEALVTGAACDLVYLGSVDVASSPGSDAVVASCAQQIKVLEPPATIITFKASKEGITLTDTSKGQYMKRHLPLTSLTYCGLDTGDTRWTFQSLQHMGQSIAIKNKQCFGVVARTSDAKTHSCYLFAELQSSQPATAVVHYVQRIMKQTGN